MGNNNSFRQPKQVLVFNAARTLIAMARSLHCIADLTGTNLQSVSFACTGKYVSANGLYFRHLHPAVLVDAGDLDSLKLQDYDDLCGVIFRYHTVKEVTRRKKLHEERRNAKKTK